MRPVSVLALALVLAPVALAQEAWFPPFDDCEAQAMRILDEATQTVDIAQYNIRSERFLGKLVELQQRGVRVRICVDKKNADKDYNTLDDAMQAAGLDLLRVLNDRSDFAIMHHKFTVVDGRTVMTGSYNWNETAQEVNEENMLVLRDPALAAAYTREFEELRGAPEVAQVGQGANVTVYFSPEDNARQAVLDQINRAQRRIVVCMFTYKDDRIARAMRDAARRGVDVTLIVEKKQADTTSSDEIVVSGGVNAKVHVVANVSSPFSAMHEKFGVFDDARVITGACNWTRTAFDFSNEDLLVIEDAALAARYTAAAGDILARYVPAAFDPARFGIDRPDVRAHVVVRCGSTQPGDTVVIVGSDPALGSWDPTRGVPLRTNESLFPTWAGRFVLPKGSDVHWKAIVLKADGSVRWEIGDDRVLTTSPRGAALATIVEFREDSPVPTPPPAPPTGGGLVGGIPGQ